MPRSKRWTYDSGLHVPLILYIPEKFRHLRPADYTLGGKTDRLVGFVDFAATVLSLAGIKPPDYFQGHAFAGKYEAPPQPYLYGFRGRMDERYDMVRTVRDQRYIYIRNFMPHRIYGQFVEYMFRTPTTAVWHRLYREGKLSPPRTHFWETKTAEELYDLVEDPDETRNLADSREHAAVLERLRDVRRDWSLSIRDLGFLPESAIYSRSGSDPPHTMGADPKRYPVERIMGMAELATSMRAGVDDELRAGIEDSDGAVRYWAALGALIRGQEGVRSLAGPLREALSDEAPAVRVAAGEALGRHGSDADATRALSVLVELADAEKHGLHVAMIALNALDYLDDRAGPALERILALPQELPGMDRRFRIYLPNLIAKIRSDFE